MPNNELCSLWQKLIDDVTNPTARKEATSRAQDMLSHLDKCSECAQRVDEIDDPGEIYLALAEKEHLSPETQEVLDKLLEATSADREAIERAMNDVLLPSLPEKLSSEMRSIADPLQIFRAIDAVSMTIERALDRESSVSPALEFAVDGSVKSHNRVVVPRANIVGEIRRTAVVSDNVADQLVNLVRSAACQYPDLFPELDTNLENDRLLLLVHEGEASGLFERWKPVQPQSVFAEALRKLRAAFSPPDQDTVPASANSGFNQTPAMAYRRALAEMAPDAFQLEDEAESFQLAISQCVAEVKLNRNKFPYYQPGASKVLPAVAGKITLDAPAGAILVVALDNFGNVLRNSAVESDDASLFCEALDSRLSAFKLYVQGGRQSPSFANCLTFNIAEDLRVFASNQENFGRNFAVIDRIARCGDTLRHVIQTGFVETAHQDLAWQSANNFITRESWSIEADSQTGSTAILKK